MPEGIEMRVNALLGVGFIVVALLVQAGCSRGGENGPNQSIVAPEQSAAKRGGDSSATGSASRPGNPNAVSGRTATPAPGVSQFNLPAGMPLVVRTTNALSTNTQVTGQSFVAHLEQALVVNGREVFAKGSEVEGRIVDSEKGGRVKGLASISVQMTRLHTASGGSVDISTSSITHNASATKKKDAVKIGIGSGIGAAIGAIAGGGKGAAIGAAAGGGAGTGVVLGTHGDAAVIPSESVLHFTLRAPVIAARLR
jgi:hypothetical protein